MNMHETWQLVRSDLYRYRGRNDMAEFIMALFTRRSFKIAFWYRLAHAFARSPGVGRMIRWKYRRVSEKYCVDMPWQTRIGGGLLLYHGFGLVVHGDSVIGNNAMIAHQVTLATEKGYAPVIGNRVRISPGAKIVGGVHIGDGAVIGANAVVVRDVPPNTVAVGVPARVLSRPFKEFAQRHFWPSEKCQGGNG